jgi:hypothetical protein
MQSRLASLSLSGNILTVLASGFILILVLVILTKYFGKQNNSEIENLLKKKNGFNSIYGYTHRPPVTYFAPDIYIVPGQAKLNHNFYTPDYLPYESGIPSIDVLRANKQIQPPSYMEQYIEHNTTPFSIRNN